VLVSLIVAMDEKLGIGKDGTLPWRLSADLKRFKELTMGHHIIAGRKTHESIGRPLPGRHTIVVSRNPDYDAQGCFVVPSLDQAVELARSRGETEAFIVGGAEIYRDALAVVDRIYLTHVNAAVAADTYFPVWDQSQWQLEESASVPADEKNQYPSTFKILSRRP
jgi:dihydrofolate reductase